MRHAFTVDLEEWFHGIELAPQSWPSTSRLRVGLDRLTRLLDTAGVAATFFVLGAVARSHPEVVRELSNSGHEIASHGDLHQFVYKQTPREFRDDLRRAAEAIHRASGDAPRGYRAPYFSITEDSRWALDVLLEEGYEYDSSIFPIRNPRYGIPNASATPFEHVRDKKTLLEIPIRPLQLLGQRVPFSGGAYLRILPWTAQSAIWRIAGRRHPYVAYVHPWELDPDHPRINLPRRIALTHYARLRTTEGRLRRLLSTHDFGRISDVFI